jgi:hypothetical protein
MNYNEIEDYEIRKEFLEDLKLLNKTEQEEIFRIIKSSNTQYSENSNGIFFDISKILPTTFSEMQQFMNFCKSNRKNFESREIEEKKAQDVINGLNM